MGARIPKYADLPIRPDLPAGSSWGVWGDDDDVGAVNFLTDDRVAVAAQLVRRGAVFSLNWSLDQPDPPILGRRPLAHTVLDGPSGTDDKYDEFFPQASSQWDALAHIKHPEHGFYNGFRREDFNAGPHGRLGIDAWGRRGIAGRFVLIDVARWAERSGRPFDPGDTASFGVAALEQALAAQRTTLAPGSILLLRFGWMAWYEQSSPETRERLALAHDFDDVERDWDHFFPAPGIEASEEMAAWLWDHEVAVVAADCPAVEAMPMSRASVETFLHFRLIPLLGLALGEMWDLERLAADCADDGVYEGLLVSAPLNKPGGAGSPANAIALK